MKFTLAVIIASAVIASAAPVAQDKIGRRAIDLGSCSDASIIFADGLDGRKEASFEPADPNSFNHGSALNIKVITGFICQQLSSKCKAPAASVTACNAGATAANALTGQAAADAFNAAVAGGAAATASTGTNGGGAVAKAVAADATTAAATHTCTDTTAAATLSATTQAATDTGATDTGAATDTAQDTTTTAAAGTGVGSLNLDLGKCTDPTIKFGGGFDGRPATEFTFLPTNSDGFFGGQQSALNPNIITNFICDNLVNRCDAGQDALDACAKAKAAVAALNVRDATVVTTFNSALGF